MKAHKANADVQAAAAGLLRNLCMNAVNARAIVHTGACRLVCDALHRLLLDGQHLGAGTNAEVVKQCGHMLVTVSSYRTSSDPALSCKPILTYCCVLPLQRPTVQPLWLKACQVLLFVPSRTWARLWQRRTIPNRSSGTRHTWYCSLRFFAVLLCATA